MTLCRIAYFVSPHGFGHAARACAVMAALRRRQPDLEFEVFTRAPRWFFDSSLDFSFGYHITNSDIGLVQSSPLMEDLPATLAALAEYIPFSSAQLLPLSHILRSLNCSVAVCDISPLGIAAAQAAGIPSILIENFTWDWIYSGYTDEYPAFSAIIPEFQRIFDSATVHIQTEPVCAFSKNATLVTHPVGRQPRQTSTQILEKLEIPSGASLVLVSMGGFELEYTFLDRLYALKDTIFVIPGGAAHLEKRDNLVLLPHHSDYYHPDLIHAADAVISKAGYSTIAEAYHAGIPFGYVSRAKFRESPVLSAFIQENMQGLPIDGSAFQSGQWIDTVPTLLRLPRIQRNCANGADQIATFLLENF